MACGMDRQKKQFTRVLLTLFASTYVTVLEWKPMGITAKGGVS